MTAGKVNRRHWYITSFAVTGNTDHVEAVIVVAAIHSVVADMLPYHSCTVVPVLFDAAVLIAAMCTDYQDRA
jgi:hypothetical protein